MDDILKAEESIYRTLSRFENSWNDHNARHFSQVFSTDADFTNVFGQTVRGAAEIEKIHTFIFSGMFKHSEIKIIEKSVRMIKPDVAAVDVKWTMSGALNQAGDAWPNRTGLMNLIMTPADENWLITVMHNTDLPVNSSPAGL